MFVGDGVKNEVEKVIRSLRPALQLRLRYIFAATARTEVAAAPRTLAPEMPQALPRLTEIKARWCYLEFVCQVYQHISRTNTKIGPDSSTLTDCSKCAKG